MTVAVKGIVASLVVVFLQDHGHAYDDIAWQLKKCPRINLPNLQELTLARHRHKEKNCFQNWITLRNKRSLLLGYFKFQISNMSKNDRVQ
jgi:hypothetical protein